MPAYFWSAAAGDGDAPHKCPRDGSAWNSSDCTPAGHGCSGTYYGQKVLNGSTDGICQETCRDFGHMAYGLASASYLAETALIQGVDLWGEQQIRMASASEFHAKWILTQPVGVPSPAPAPSYLCNGLGLKLEDLSTFEVGFNALHNRLEVIRETCEPNTFAPLQILYRGSFECLALSVPVLSSTRCRTHRSTSKSECARRPTRPPR